jgi:hypothetical protein
MLTGEAFHAYSEVIICIFAVANGIPRTTAKNRLLTHKAYETEFINQNTL